MTTDPRMLEVAAGRTWGVLASVEVRDRRLVVRFRPEHVYGRLR